MLGIEAGFLKAIAADPDDDTPRLVYADWLDEDGGDPKRAELIRIQVGLERGGDWQSDKSPDTQRLAELRAREQELITEMLAPHEADERPGIREFETMPEIMTAENIINEGGFLSYETQINTEYHPRVTFRRGMIEHLNLANTGINKLPPKLFVGGNLYLYGTCVTSLPADLHVGGYLNLAHTRIAELGLGLHVGGDLDLANTRITSLPADLHVGGYLDLTAAHLTAEAAQLILTIPNLSREARITGLETAGFHALAAEARRLPETNADTGTPPRQ